MRAFSVSTLLVGWQEGHPACKTEWWGAGVVICLERGADFHMAQLMLLPLTVSCFSEIRINFTFLVPADPGIPGKMAVKRVRVRACVRACVVNACFCCVSFSFFHTKSKDWLGETSPKWSILCRRAYNRNSVSQYRCIYSCQ